MSQSVTGNASVIRLEHRVLAFLCQLPVDASARKCAFEALSRYVWIDAVHRAVFEIVMSMASASREVLRDQLPARLTRHGFPDFDFDALFRSPVPSSAEAGELIGELVGGG